MRFAHTPFLTTVAAAMPGWLICLALAATGVARAEEFTFLVSGDTHVFSPTAFEDARRRVPKALFLVNTGDNLPTGAYGGQPGFKQQVARGLGDQFPWFAAVGNHNSDTPADMEYIITDIVPKLRSQSPKLTNFSEETLPVKDVAITAFDMFMPTRNDDQREAILKRLIEGKVGVTDAPDRPPLEGKFFIWANPTQKLAEFSALLDTLDFSGCVMKVAAFSTPEKIKNGLKMIYMANKISPYSFDCENAHFVVLNLYYDDYKFTGGRLSPRQLAWLERDLTRNTKPIAFVFGHEPCFPLGGRHLGDSLDYDPEVRDRFLELLRKNRGVVYFSGHTHIYGRSFHDGVYDVGVGETGLANNELGRYIYVAVRVNEHRVTFETYASDYTKGGKGYYLLDNWTVDTRNPRLARWRTLTPGPGGWVTALAIDPNNSKRVLAGGDMFGAAVSHDGGLTWEHSLGFRMTEIESFTFLKSPYNRPSYRVLAATRGGVYESYDGGFNWMEKTAGPAWPLQSETEFTRPVSTIAFGGGNVYAASGSIREPEFKPAKLGTIHRFRLATDGQIWEPAADLKVIPGIGPGSANIQSLVAQQQPNKPERLFASVLEKGVWRSNDGGKMWQKASPPIDDAFTLVSHPTTLDTLYVAGGDKGIFKTTDGGTTWTHLEVEVRTQVLGLCTKQPEVLYVTSYNGPNRGIMKSTDAGKTWRKVLDSRKPPLLPYRQGTFNLRWRALAVDPNDPNHVIAGDDVNLYVTFDGGTTWQSAGGTTTDKGRTWTSSNFNGISAECIAFDPRDAKHFILGGSDGALWQTWDKGKTFSRDVTDALQPGVDPGEVFSDFQDAEISPEDSKTIYLISDVAGKEDDNWGPLYKTTDGGGNWAVLNPGPFVSMKLHHGDKNVLLAIAGAKEHGIIKRSTDGGRSFTNVTDAIGAVKLSRSTSNPNTYYATSKNGVYESTDAGATWKIMGGPRVWNRYGKVAEDPKHPGVVYATDDEGFWKYDGKRWAHVKKVDRASDIAVTKEGTIYGTTLSFPTHDRNPITVGVWRSDDEGANWYLDTEGIHIRRSTIVEASPLGGAVIVGGDGGGFSIFDFDAEKK